MELPPRISRNHDTANDICLVLSRQYGRHCMRLAIVTGSGRIKRFGTWESRTLSLGLKRQ